MSKRSRVWSDEEEAYLLNYLDYCLKHQLRYQDEITAAMSRFAGRSITINSAMSKLAQVSLRNGGERSTKALVTNGTNELALQRVPGRVLRAMQAQRADLELEDLATELDTTNDETPDEHMTNNDAVGESSRNAGNTVRGNARRAPAPRSASASTAGYGERTAKRKAPASETIDLTEEARPSKRRALGRNTGKAVAGSEPTASVSVQGTIEKSGQHTGPQSQPQHQGTNITAALDGLNKNVEDVTFIVHTMLREFLKQGGELTPDMDARLTSLRRTMKAGDTDLFKSLFDQIKGLNILAETRRNTLFTLIDVLDTRGNAFPEAPKSKDLNMRWEALRRGIRNAFDRGVDTEDSSIPGFVDSIYLGAIVDDLAKNAANIEKKEIKAYFAKFAPRLKSRYSVETLLGALLCKRLFATPDPTCTSMYSQKELGLLKTIIQAGDIAKAQQLDKIGARMLFKDEALIPHVEEEVEFILSYMSMALSEMCPGAPGFHGLASSRDWLRKAIKLRQDLMLSPQEYRVHFCQPAAAFDPTWMKAVDIYDCPVPDFEMPQHPKVLTCMFPALVEEKAPALTEMPDVSEILIMNKKFLPDYLAEFDPKMVVCKAAVLLVPVENKGTHSISQGTQTQ